MPQTLSCNPSRRTLPKTSPSLFLGMPQTLRCSFRHRCQGSKAVTHTAGPSQNKTWQLLQASNLPCGTSQQPLTSLKPSAALFLSSSKLPCGTLQESLKGLKPSTAKGRCQNKPFIVSKAGVLHLQAFSIPGPPANVKPSAAALSLKCFKPSAGVSPFFKSGDASPCGVYLAD